MFYTMTQYGRCWNRMEAIVESGGRKQNIVQNSMERNGDYWKLLVSYRSWARLAPTLTHITMCDPVISGAEDDVMSSLSV